MKYVVMQIKEIMVKVSNLKGKKIHIIIYFKTHVAIYIFVLKPFDCHRDCYKYNNERLIGTIYLFFLEMELYIS